MSSSVTAVPSGILPAGPALSARRLSRLYWVAAIMLLLSHAVLVWQSRSPAVETAANDDAQYLLLARSLRSFHYQDQHLPGSPVHAQYPPVYPAMIAVATGVFGEHLNVAQAVTLLCSVLALLLIYDMARRLASPLVGLLLLAPLAFNAHLVGYAGRIASESPYIFLSVGSLWLLVAFPRSPRVLLWVGTLAILAALTRSVGLSLVIALLLLLLLQRKFKWAAVLAVLAGLTVGTWLTWTAVAPNKFTERSYAAVATNTGSHAPTTKLGLLAVRSGKFVKIYVAKSFAAGLELPTLEGTSLDNVVWILLILGLGGAGFWSVRKRLPLLPLYVLCFLGLLLAYPFKMTRFFMPVAPLVLLSMFLGAVVLTRRKPVLGLAVLVLLSGLLLLESVPRSLKLVKRYEHCDRSATESTQCFRPETNAFLAATRRAREVVPPDGVVLTIKEAAFNYYTERKVYHPDLAYKKGGRNMLAFLQKNGIDFALISAYVGGAEFSTLLEPACDRIEVLGRYEPRTALLRIYPAGGSVPTARNACQLIQAWTKRPDPSSEESENADEVGMLTAPVVTSP